MSAYQGTFENSGAGRNSAGPEGFGRSQGRRQRVRWRAVEIFGMVLGFVVFWPIGLAIVFLKIWQKREGRPDQDLADFVHERVSNMRASCSSRRAQWGVADWKANFTTAPRPTGNSAFDDWRSAELARLEEERQKLVQAERDFAEHLDRLRRARDREEFDRFMAERNAGQSSQA